MTLTKIKKFFLKHLPLILGILLIIIFIIVDIYLPKKALIILTLIFLLLIIVGNILLKHISKAYEIKIPIKDKIATLEKLYEIFNLEKTNTLVFVNTKKSEIVDSTMKYFKEAKPVEHKKNFSIILPRVKLTDLKKFLKKVEPELLIFHQFATIEEGKKRAMHSMSACIEKKLIIRFDKNTFTKEDVKEITNEFKKVNN